MKLLLIIGGTVAFWFVLIKPFAGWLDSVRGISFVHRDPLDGDIE